MRIGDQIKFIPDLHHGWNHDNKVFTGVVVYINERNHWFTLEYIERGNRLRESFKFYREMEREDRYNNGSKAERLTPQQFQNIPGVAIF